MRVSTSTIFYNSGKNEVERVMGFIYKSQRMGFRGKLRKFIRKEERAKNESRGKIIQKTQDVLPSFLKRFKTVRGVSIVGSVAKKQFYSRTSDVDLLVKGLREKDYFPALLFWEKNLSLPVDLIREEEARDKLSFLKKGRVTLCEKY